MVFGFGKGKIELILEKYNFSPGDVIKGKVILKLKEPIKARALKVGLVGETRSGPQIQVGSIKTSKSSSQQRRVFYFEMPLDSEKEYLEGEYSFEIKIPSNLPTISSVQGIVGDILKGLQALSSGMVYWYVFAKLDIPSGLDVSKKVQVNIG